MRPLLPVLASLVVALGLAGPADAAVRTATLNDPMDAQNTTPSLDPRPVSADITQVVVNYDDTGAVGIAVTFADASDVPPAFTVTLSCSDAPAFTATLRRESDFENGWEDHGTGRLEGFDGSIDSVTRAPAGSRTMTAAFAHGALANRGYRCLSGSWTEIEYGDRADSVTGWFAGREPMAVTAAGARAQADRYLRGRLGARYSRAGSRYLNCPRQQLFPPSDPFDEDEGDSSLTSASALCRYFARTGSKVATGELTVTADDEARVLKVKAYPRTYTRRWHNCSRSLRANRPCGGLTMLASDIESAAGRRFPRKPAARRTVIAHGTNTAGFGPLVDYRCRTRSRMAHGPDGPYRHSSATCANALGERFRFTFVMA